MSEIKDGICYIVGASELDSLPEKNDGDYIIAADGGYRYFEKSSVQPDVVMGDFDSLGYLPQGVNTLTFPVKKDDTDTMLAVKYAYDMGYRKFELLGCMGGRGDHTAANIQTMVMISRNGGQATMHGRDMDVTAITDGKISFDDNYTGTISVFSATQICKGVTIRGMKYKLDDAELTFDNPMGVSNSFVRGTFSEIEVKSGTLIIMYNIRN